MLHSLLLLTRIHLDPIIFEDQGKTSSGRIVVELQGNRRKRHETSEDHQNHIGPNSHIFLFLESEFDTFHNQTSVVLLDVPKDGQDREDRNKSKNKNGRKKNQRKKDENEYETRKEKSNNYFQPNSESKL